MIFVVSLVVVAVLVAVHLFSYRLRFLDGTPRSIWLSLAGGVSVAYVFVHLLPELAEGQEAIAEAAGEGLAFLKQHVYLVALLGLATFYGLDRLATESRRRNRLASGLDALVLFALATALHFVVNDYGLHRDQKGDYVRVGRWIIAAAVIIGWAVGLAFEVPEAAIAVLTAFLGGGIIMNVLKEELPEERQSRFWAFAAGAAAYASLLLIVF